MARYQITKTYSPDNGLSATFRQWRAQSHCRFLHGYALGFRATLEVPSEADLDENGWVYNYGDFKEFKQWLADTFDHKTLVALDDPLIAVYQNLARASGFLDKPLIQMVEVERTGCEAFAKLAYQRLAQIIGSRAAGREVYLVSMEVFEHGGNSAIYFG